VASVISQRSPASIVIWLTVIVPALPASVRGEFCALPPSISTLKESLAVLFGTIPPLQRVGSLNAPVPPCHTASWTSARDEVEWSASSAIAQRFASPQLSRAGDE